MATLDDLASDLTEVRVTTAGIAARLDAALASAEDHEKRLRALERWRWMVAGVSGASGAVVGVLATIVQTVH
jgi:hypothetical protein